MKKIVGILALLIVIVIVVAIIITNAKNNEKIKEDENREQEFNQKLLENFGKIQVFIKTDTDKSEVEELRKNINNIDGVKEIEYKSKDEALNELRNKFNGNKELFDAYEGENNIFPDSFIIKLDTNIKIEDIDKIAKQIEESDNIEKVTSSVVTIKEIIKYHNVYTELTYEELIKKLKIDDLGV